MNKVFFFSQLKYKSKKRWGTCKTEKVSITCRREDLSNFSHKFCNFPIDNSDRSTCRFFLPCNNHPPIDLEIPFTFVFNGDMNVHLFTKLHLFFFSLENHCIFTSFSHWGHQTINFIEFGIQKSDTQFLPFQAVIYWRVNTISKMLIWIKTCDKKFEWNNFFHDLSAKKKTVCRNF